MKKYMVYMDDGRDCFKVAVPANNEKAARKYVEGNGEVISVKDVTKDFPISLDKVAQALKNAQFGQIEIDLIIIPRSNGIYHNGPSGLWYKKPTLPRRRFHAA